MEWSDLMLGYYFSSQLYSGLELSDNDYFGNALRTTLFGTNYAFSKLREKVNKTDWVSSKVLLKVLLHPLSSFLSPTQNSLPGQTRPARRGERLLLSAGEFHPISGRDPAGSFLQQPQTKLPQLRSHRLGDRARNNSRI